MNVLVMINSETVVVDITEKETTIREYWGVVPIDQLNETINNYINTGFEVSVIDTTNDEGM